MLEDLSQPALVVALDEFAVQSHLLFRAYLMSLARRIGEDDAMALGYRTFVGLAGITAERLTSAAGLLSHDAEAVAKLLQLHPIFHPRSYVDLRVEVVDERRVRLAVWPCPALEENDLFTWLACLDQGGVAPLDAIVRAVEHRARCHPVDTRPGEARAYEAVLDPDASPSPEPADMTLVRFSTGADFRFRPS